MNSPQTVRAIVEIHPRVHPLDPFLDFQLVHLSMLSIEEQAEPLPLIFPASLMQEHSAVFEVAL